MFAAVGEPDGGFADSNEPVVVVVVLEGDSPRAGASICER